ncbi:phosphodiester glycosidase family protein [Desulfosporosinus nitroreducens]|uniref:Phosphodiester glycosidase family protein n=1 Tax=Desulfosporosinus nitroreducens TaxID=2018668 RepID=A0ABT8QJ98_9FIRM|nr:phosphodiester glycosidase family protein [Desulfosporosinus nitroreducens]MCO1600279.1 phosphodiester glycosidase family protein [Desulfosporosinus nitroreducens]MDO0821367.1 phosphodiester glycosidase family protein [Desulfosporosinus nitroreducens]
MKKKGRIKIKKIFGYLVFNIIFAAILVPFILFWGPFESLKIVAVGAVATSRHPQVVEAFLSQEEISRIMNSNNYQGSGNGIDLVSTEVMTDKTSGITIEDIKGQSFKGKVMLIKDPMRVKLAVTKEIGVTGERVTDFVKDMGAIAGINAGGFYDPNGKGNGAFPDGLTMHDGKLIHNNVEDKAVNIVGFDDKGKLVLGKMNAKQLEEKNMREVVTFEPNLIVDGKPAITGDGGWGIAPRTGIGQMADGTVIFVVIDGRQPTWSIGATLRDLMNVFEDYNAVNAVNLDGGSSSELVYNGKVMNKLWNIFGERYIPTAFVVTK